MAPQVRLWTVGLLPKYLEFPTALRTFLFPNLHCVDSQNPPQPSDDGGKGPLVFHVLTPTLRTLHFSRWISNNHGSTLLC